jgi:putative chitinase
MPIHRKYFFDRVRASLFGGSLTESQVDGLNQLLDYAEQHGTDDRQLAYVLASVYHETAKTMQPITEYGSTSYLKGKPYYPYYGRGLIQITWKENYQKQDQKLGLGGTLVANPDRALEWPIALAICFGGMADGDFTGVCLGDHIACRDPATDSCDYYHARKIVNALDCASQIEGYAYHFANALVHVAGPAASAAEGRTS